MKKHLIVSLAIILSLLIIGCGKVAKETGSSGGGSNSSSGPGTTPLQVIGDYLVIVQLQKTQ